MAILWFVSIPIKKSWAKKYTSQGIEYFKAENDRQAILEFQKSNLLYKTSENYYYLGQLYFFNDNFGRAEYYFKKALAKDEANNSAAYGLSELYLTQEKPDKALQIMQNRNKDELSSIALTRVYLAQNDGERAAKTIENFDTDLAKFYKAKVALYNLTDLNSTTDLLSGILTDQTKDKTRTILPQVPSQSEVAILENALSQIQKVSNPATKKVILGEALNQTGDASVALGILKKISKENSKYRDSKVFLGHSYLIIGDYGQAKETLLAAKELDPVYSLTWQYLADAYKGLGDQDSAKSCQEKADKLE